MFTRVLQSKRPATYSIHPSVSVLICAATTTPSTFFISPVYEYFLVYKNSNFVIVYKVGHSLNNTLLLFSFSIRDSSVGGKFTLNENIKY